MNRYPSHCFILALAIVLAQFIAGCDEEAPAPMELRHSGFEGRADLILRQTADRYTPTKWHDRGKFTFPKTLARMHLYGETDKQATGYINEYRKGRYGFFHFPFVGMARILGQFPEAPAVVENREDFLRRILLHKPGDHYNGLTGEGTENHVAMSRTSGYLFAQEAAEIPGLEETARRWQELIKDWSLDWAYRIFHYGTGEWDSNVYTTYNIIGWLNLYDFAEDPEVREAARAVLDYYAANLALKYTQGVLGGPESRGGSQKQMALPRSATEYLGWLWFGPDELAKADGFFSGGEYIQSVHAALSSYRPPEILADLALKRIPVPALYHNTKPNYQLTRKAESTETFLIEDAFTLGTVETPHGGWLNTAYGIINWKLVIRNRDGLPAVVTGNGGMKSTENGRGRNPFDQFFQFGPVVVQMTRVPDNAEAIAGEVGRIFEDWRETSMADFLERWGHEEAFPKDHLGNNGRGSLETASLSIIHFPESIEPVIEGTTAFFQYADVLVSAVSLSGEAPTAQPGKLIDNAERNQISGFVIEVADIRDHGSLEHFMETTGKTGGLIRPSGDSVAFSYQTLDGTELQFAYSLSGSWQEMIYDWGSGVTEQRVGYNTEDWLQPDWPSGPGHGRLVEVRANGVVHKPHDPETVLDGPFLSLRNGILTIEAPNGDRYTVDADSLPTSREKDAMRNSTD